MPEMEGFIDGSVLGWDDGSDVGQCDTEGVSDG